MLIKNLSLLGLWFLFISYSLSLPIDEFDEIVLDCEDSEFGCCPDGITLAQGPLSEGCIDFSCEKMEFGCCDDMVTPATNLLRENCPKDCTESFYGCCPDQIHTARGAGFAGCNITNAKGSSSPTTQSYLFNEFFEDDSKETLFLSTTTKTKQVLIDDGSSDVCSLIADGGSCYNYAIQWAYNSMSGKCEQFWYGGCDGNLNRFDTQEACEARCVSPPGLGVCYLKPINPLNGECSDNQIRYFYDENSGMCKEFLYSGCFGNANNFRTLDECEKKCRFQIVLEQCSLPAEKGPCNEDQLRWHFDSSSGICKFFSYGGCKGNKNNFASENDCVKSCVAPRQKNVCILPTLSGNCKESQEKWSYDVKTGTCKKFTYSGCNGNLNRFDTKQACEYTCQGLKAFEKETPAAICHEPKVIGTCSEKIQRWYFNKTTQMCDKFTFTGCSEVGANNFEDEYSCRSMCNAKEINPCVLSSDIGSGSDYQLYYYYNQEKKYCQGFYYGGFDGNANRFKTIDDCEMACVLSKEEQKYLSRLPQRCIYPSDKGTDCTQITTKYHFEAKTNECYAYDYSGCGLEYSNRFETTKECLDTCNITQFLRNVSLTEIDLTELRDNCEQPLEIGNCGEKQLRWYFDSIESKSCKSFEYSGCNGNKNNFPTKSSCVETCEMKKKKEICHSQKSEGPCLFHQEKWYFNSQSKKCEAFSYGGCLGNENRFNSKFECEQYCSEYISDKTIKIITDTTKKPNIETPKTTSRKPAMTITGDDYEDLDYGNYPTEECPLMTNCYLKCQIGLAKDSNGCERCECINPCTVTTCPIDFDCVVEESEAKCILRMEEYSTAIDDEFDTIKLENREQTELFEGSIAVLPCDVPENLGSVEVIWFKNNYQIEFSAYNGRVIKAFNNSLIIYNVTDKDDATYTCKLITDDNLENISKETKLVINEPLEIMFSPDDREFSLNSDATLFCNLKGNAKIERIKWYRKNELIQINEKYDLVGPSLTIKQLQISDFGPYTCEIVTQYGSITDVAKIKIKELKLDCSDIISYLNCKVIVSKNLCPKYGEYCCRSCREAGYDVKMEKKKF